MADDSFAVRDKVAAFATYEDYLESQISETDHFYLESEDVARQLVELGYRGSGDTLKRDEFEARKKADKEKHLHKEAAPKPLASMGKALADRPFLQALAAREELVRNGKLTCIVFVRDVNAKGQEVSGYIDLAHRLKTENWAPYFEGRLKVLPRPSDLSYFNWDTQTSTSNASPNFAVIADSEAGMLFKNKASWSAATAGQARERAGAAHAPALAPDRAAPSPPFRLAAAPLPPRRPPARPPARSATARSSTWTRARTRATTRLAPRCARASACRPSSSTTLRSGNR